MPFIHCDTDELREFSRELSQYRTDTSDRLVHLKQWLDDIGRSAWTDENFKLYEDRFTRAYDALQALLMSEVDERFLPLLQQHIQRYEDTIG